MLAERIDAPFSSPDWLFELKYDGYRMIGAREERRGRAVHAQRRACGARASPRSRARSPRCPSSRVDPRRRDRRRPTPRAGPSFARLQQRASLERPRRRRARDGRRSRSRTSRSTCSRSGASTCATCRSRQRKEWLAAADAAPRGALRLAPWFAGARRGRVRGDPRAPARGHGRQARRLAVSLRPLAALEEAAPARERRLRDRRLQRRARQPHGLRLAAPRVARGRRAALLRPRRHGLPRRGARLAARGARRAAPRRRRPVSARVPERAATSGWSRASSARCASAR